MEDHPIPQDVTGFQFKLIGDMTIKQFAYVASGAAIAWFFYAALPLPGLLKLPVAAFFALFGTGFAFLPVSGRPMDTMAYNFIKALFAPSKYVYQKEGGQLFATVPQSNLLNSQASPVTFVKTGGQDTSSSVAVNPNSSSSQAPHIISTSGEEKPEEKKETQVKEEQEENEKKQYLEKEESVLEKELETAKEQETQAVNTPTFSEMHAKVLELEKILQETAAQRQELERQIISLQQKLSNQAPNAFSPTPAAPKKETKNIRSIPAGMRRSVGVPLAPEFPNLLTGIVKDPRGNPLPSILVEVKDKEGNPVRAFKTNGLGQFASATALTNGTYDISLEDPRGQNKFDTVEITATGEIILPLEIISQDAREELRKALFA